MTTQVPDLYRTLGVGRDATTEAIEAAYTGWQARLSAGEPISTQEWERLRYAHEVLSNPQRRSLYDSLVAETTVSSLDLSVAVSAARGAAAAAGHAAGGLRSGAAGRPRDNGRAAAIDPRPRR